MSLPQVLMSNVQNEQQNVEIETILLPPAQHSFQDKGFAQSVFRLQKKGILDSHSSLVFEVRHTSHTALTTTTPQRFSGCIPIQSARLYLGGVLVDELQEAQSFLGMAKSFGEYQHRANVQDVKLGSDNRYETDENGCISLENSPDGNGSGSRVCKDTKAPQFSILIQELFKSLENVQLPLGARGFPEAVIEIDWVSECDKVLCSDQDTGGAKALDTFVAGANVTWQEGEKCIGTVAGKTGAQMGDGDAVVSNGNVKIIGNVKTCDTTNNTAVIEIVEGGKNMADNDTITWTGMVSGATASTNDVDGITAVQVDKTMNIPVSSVVMICDYLHYPQEVNQALESQLANEGLGFPFTSRTLIKKQLAGVTNGVERTQDIMIGQQGKYIQKIFIQKLNTSHNNYSAVNKVANVMLSQRSDRINGEKIQLIVNNKNLLDREISSDNYAYSLLNQTWEKGVLAVLPSQYGHQYVANDVRNNVGQLSNTAVKNGVGVNRVYDYDKATAGRCNWKGLPLFRFRNGQVSPLNSTKLGASPALLRMTRTGLTGEDTAPVDLNIWVESIKMASVQGGNVSVIDM
tara:strand:- start:3234 stop:4955 length:1722 start_codon:yes stop_codon:yes gene_type:complete